MKIIGLSGYGRSGKDSVGAVLASGGYNAIAFADPFRELLLHINPRISCRDRLHAIISEIGWDEAKKAYPEIRLLMQRLGGKARKVFGDDIWINALWKRINPYENYAITDCRYINEATAVIDHGGVVWRVTRPGVGPANDHESEVALDDWDFDKYIDNDGTLEDLHVKVLRAIS